MRITTHIGVVEISTVDPKFHEEIFTLHAQICGALADPVRLLILYVLAEQHRNVNGLAAALELPQPTISRHLKTLREQGMVMPERQGQTVVYSLTDRRIIEALDILRAFMADSLRSRSELVRGVGADGTSR